MSEPDTAPTVRVYADYVCPFCYLGYASLEEYRAERDASLSTEWHPFDLQGRKRQPDGSLDRTVDDGKDEQYYEQARENVRRLAEEYAVEMADELRTDVDSYDAQRVALRAREQHPDAFATFHRGVFEAMWTESRDVGDTEVLESVAADAGLPDGFVAATLTDGDSAERLREAFQAAEERGVTGVPTFEYDGYAARGAVPPGQLRRLVEST